jgi:hypothetical protein
VPRQNRRRRDDDAPEVRPLAAVGERHESFRGIDYVVRSITGSGATKPYRCPGCDQLIRPATPHIVAWPADDADADERRHWHTACWRSRGNRTPGVQRSRSAPRY